MPLDDVVVRRFHRVLVDEIRRESPEYLTQAFTVAEIYQSLVPYRSHRDQIGVELNGDYEAALLQLLSGQGNYLELESEPARARIQRELKSSNPNTGMYRDYAAVQVRLNPERIPEPGADPIVDPSEAGSERGGNRSDESDGGSEVQSLPGRGGAGGPKSAGSSGADPTKSSSTSGDATEGKASKSSHPGSRVDAASKEKSGTGSKPAGPRPRTSPPEECPDCQSALPDRESLRFCPFCGTNVFIMPCGECGEVLERAWLYCVACGTPTED